MAKLRAFAILRACIAGVVLTACLTSPVYAQRRGAPIARGPDDRDKDRDAEFVDKQYKATLERTKKDAVAAPAADPWQNLRGNDDPKTKR
jgi:hypothetical protein